MEGPPQKKTRQLVGVPYFISCSKRGQGAWGPLARAVVTLVARYLTMLCYVMLRYGFIL